MKVILGYTVDSEDCYIQYINELSKGAEFDYTMKIESIENTVINILSVIAMGSALVFISGGVFGFAVPGYIATVGQVSGGILTAKDIGHLVTGKDINGNPLSEADKQGITSSLIVDATMSAANSLSKLKLKYANKVNKVEVIEVGSKPNIKYDYDMIKNPGSLSKMEGQPAANFYGGKYNIEVLTKDRIYYRVGQDGKPLGQWFTSKPAESVTKVRIDTAVKEQWINPITGTSIINTNYVIKTPKGTTVYTDPVGYQGGMYLGVEGIIQTFIPEPWKLDVEVISKIPLK